MSRITRKFSGLLAAAMLLVQVQVCPCSEVLHSHNTAQASQCCLYHTGGQSLDSNQPTHEGRRCPCTELCQCESGDSQTAIIADAVATDRMIRNPLHRSGGTWVLSVVLPSLPEGSGHRADFAMDAAIYARGNPCAQLSRWLL